MCPDEPQNYGRTEMFMRSPYPRLAKPPGIDYQELSAISGRRHEFDAAPVSRRTRRSVESRNVLLGGIL